MFLFESCVWLRPVCRSNTACFGCLVVQLFGCSVVRLLSCSVARPLGGIGGTAAGRIDVSGDAGCIPAVLSGIGFRLAFRTSFSDLFRDWLPGLLRDLLFGPASGSASRSAFGPAFRTSFPDQLSGLASGSAFRMQVLFCLIVECEVWFRSGRRIRLRNFCRSSSRRRACNSLLPVFLDLRRVPMI